MDRPKTPLIDQLAGEISLLANAHAREQAELLARRTPVNADMQKQLAELRAANSYELSYLRFESWQVFYVSVWGEITYKDSGIKRYFWGKGGGVGIGGGIWVAGGGSPTIIPAGPDSILGECAFVFTPLTIGAQVSFTRNGVGLGTLVGAGAGTGGVFGGTATWTKAPQVDADGRPL